MNTKILTKPLSILLSVLMLVSVFMIAGTNVNAAESPVSITIGPVTRQYGEVKKLLDLFNEYREENDLPLWKINKNSMEKAMVRASELSVYYSASSPDGTSYNSTANHSQMFGYKVTNYYTFIEQLISDQSGNQILNDTYASVGIGVVKVNSIRYVCILFSEDTLEEVDESVYDQGDISVNQEISALPSLISNVSMNTSDTKIVCGGATQLRLKIINTENTDLSAYLVADSVQAAVSDSTICSITSTGYISAIKPGTVTATLAVKSYPSISKSIQVTAVARNLSKCTVADIPDQAYTGSEIKPSVTVKYSDGTILVKDKDYKLLYSDNVEIGTATVTIVGINAYEGEIITKTFNIVESGAVTVFDITGSVSVSSLSVGEKVQCSATTTGGSGTIQYQFSCSPVDSQSWTTIRSYSTENTYSYSPQTEGTYYIKVTAKDSSGATATSTSKITVYPELECEVKLNTSELVLGNSVSITADASGAVSPYKYAFYVQKSGSSTLTTINDFSTTKTVSYKPESVGTYNISVKVQSSTGYTIQKYATFKVVEPTLTNNSTISSTSITLGNTLTLKGAAVNGTTPYQYAYSYKHSSETSYTAIKSYSTTASTTWKPTKTGTYSVCIKVKDANGTEVKKFFTLTVNPVTELKNNSTISATSITLGHTVTLKGVASGGLTPYQYAYSYKHSSETAYTVIKSYSTTASTTWKPTKTGTYSVCIKVKDANGTEVKKFFTLKVNALTELKNNSTISATSITLGHTVTLKGVASGGLTSYKYAYSYKHSSETAYTVIKSYSTTSSTTWKPTQTGTYSVCVKVKDANGTEVKKFFTLKVNALTELKNNSTISATSITLGHTVTLKGVASGGLTSYKYAYLYKHSSETAYTAIKSYSTTASTTWKPTQTGTYSVCVKVKDANGTEVKKFFTLKVNALTELKNNSTISATSITLGHTVTLKGVASGGLTSYKYAYSYKHSSETAYTAIKSYSTTASTTWKPTKTGTYSVCIKVKDANGTEVKKFFTLKVNALTELKNNSTISATSITLGNTVTLNGVASGGLTPYQYAYSYKHSSETSYTVIKSYSTTASTTWKPTQTGTYSVCIKVKDANGTEVKKFFTLKVS